MRNLPEELTRLRDKALCLRAFRALRVSIIVTVEVGDFHQADSPLGLCLKIATLEEGDLHILVTLEVDDLHIPVTLKVGDLYQADRPLGLRLKLVTLEEGDLHILVTLDVDDLHIPVALEVGDIHQADRPLGLCLKGLIEGALATTLTSAARVLIHAWLSSSLFSLDPQPHPMTVSRGPTHKPPVDLPCPSVAEVELTQDLLAQH